MEGLGIFKAVRDMSCFLGEGLMEGLDVFGAAKDIDCFLEGDITWIYYHFPMWQKNLGKSRY